MVQYVEKTEISNIFKYLLFSFVVFNHSKKSDYFFDTDINITVHIFIFESTFESFSKILSETDLSCPLVDFFKIQFFPHRNDCINTVIIPILWIKSLEIVD